MVIKLYISGISGNKEVKKKQQRVQMILDSKQISYEAIDITEPGKEKDKEFMQQNGKVRESLGKYPLPPQIFNDDDFCGDYEDFDMANEVDELEKFLHIETNSKNLENGSKQSAKSASLSKESLNSNKLSKSSSYDLYNYHTFRIKYDCVNGLQEEIINTKNLSRENEQVEEISKSEVNGESEVVPSEIPSADNKPEISTEEVPFSTKEVLEEKENEKKTTNENTEKKSEENEPDNQESEIKVKEGETKADEGSDIENANEEESPHSEEEKKDEGKVRNESEEEKEDSDSPPSEKSQED